MPVRFLAVFFSVMMASVVGFAAVPQPWQLGLQEPASPVMENFFHFHTILLYVIFAIAIFVTLLLVYVCVRFREKRNPVPSKTTHNLLLEVLWTGVPVLILIALVIPSIRSLYFADRVPASEMTVKVIGYQWYWGYQYPDHGNIAFDSYMLQDKDLKEGDVRLLSVDNAVVLPVDTNVRLQITSADVIHSFAIPALGVKRDAVPGRLNETWVRITKPGKYYGQCSELCGSGHGFMPIMIDAVSREEFAAWVAQKQKK